jgi:hypothetical protein
MKISLRAVAFAALACAIATPTFAATHHKVVHHVVRHGHHVYHGRVAYIPPPPPEPRAYIHFHGGAVGFIVGVGGGDGYVSYHGERYPIEISGIKVGTIGVSSYEVDGEVFHLHHLEDIEGSYGAGEASATAGAGAGSLDMSNDRGVEIHASSTSAGLQLTLAPGGVTIHLKR